MNDTGSTSVLQALARGGVLKSERGSTGGYVLARAAGWITADDILRAVGSLTKDGPLPPPLARAEDEFSIALKQIKLRDLLGATEKSEPFR